MLDLEEETRMTMMTKLKQKLNHPKEKKSKQTISPNYDSKTQKIEIKATKCAETPKSGFWKY